MAKIKSSVECTVEEFIKELTSNSSPNPFSVIKSTKKSIILKELSKSRYDHLRSEAIRMMLNNNKYINTFCDEILDIVAPQEASEDQRQILMNIIGRSVYASVYMQKLDEMSLGTYTHSMQHTVLFDDTSTECTDTLEKLRREKMESYPQLKLSKQIFQTRTFKDTNRTIDAATVGSSIQRMRKIPYFSRDLGETKRYPYIDTARRLKQYLYNGGRIEDIQTSKLMERQYNAVCLSVLKAWYNTFLIINSDVDKKLGMSKFEMYQALNSQELRFAVKGICELEKLGIKFSDVALRRAIKNYEKREDVVVKEKKTRRDSERKGDTIISEEGLNTSEESTTDATSNSSKAEQERNRDRYIIETAIDDILSKVPKHANIEEWIAYITEDTISELRAAGESEIIISQFNTAMSQAKAFILEEKQKNKISKNKRNENTISDNQKSEKDVYEDYEFQPAYETDDYEQQYEPTILHPKNNRASKPVHQVSNFDRLMNSIDSIFSSQKSRDNAIALFCVTGLLALNGLIGLIEHTDFNVQKTNPWQPKVNTNYYDEDSQPTSYIQDNNTEVDFSDLIPVIKLACDRAEIYTEESRANTSKDAVEETTDNLQQDEEIPEMDKNDTAPNKLNIGIVEPPIETIIKGEKVPIIRKRRTDRNVRD